MNRQDPVKVAVLERHSRLAIGSNRIDARMSFPDPFRHVLSKLKSIIVGFLFGCQHLVIKVFPQPGADLKRGAKRLGRVLDGELVIEVFDQSIFSRQNLMPVFHEVVVDAPLLLGQRWQGLGPFRRSSELRSHGLTLKSHNPVAGVRRGLSTLQSAIVDRYTKPTILMSSADQPPT